MPNLLKYLSLAATLALSSAPVAQSQGFAGAFLAANSANIANDYAEAAYYYTQAMIAEPENGFIMQGAMFAFVAAGDVSAGAAIARKMAAAGFKDEYAHTVMVADAMARADYDATLGLLADSSFEINPLVRQLVSGWALVGSGEPEAAHEIFESETENEAITAFGFYNKGMALAYSGDLEAADALFRDNSAYVNRGSVLTHAQVLAG